MDAVAAHEAELTAYALERLRMIQGLRLYGSTDPTRAAERVGVLPMSLEGVPHFLAASVMGYEFGIGVRSGCFCAHPYLLHLLDVPEAKARAVREKILSGDRREMPGLLRASFGLYNSFEDVDWLAEALGRIQRGQYQGKYQVNPASGEFIPAGWACEYEKYFQF
jgi:cysteine desulfurase/selenocysteine lyase